MKVILYMAMTVNGMIATEEGDSSWTSPTDEASFRELAKQTGNVVLGRNTYDYLVKQGEFPLADTLNIVMTSRSPEAETSKNVVFMDGAPEEVLADLAGRGFAEVLLGGGGELAGSFMTDGLIDELIVTVAPVIFGRGIHLFEHGEFARTLTLLGAKKLSDHEVQLHYAITKGGPEEARQTLDSYLGEGE